MKMNTNNLLGQISVKARHIDSSSIVEAIVSFEDRDDSVYYCWSFHDSSGSMIAAKCLPISHKIINGEKFDFAIEHARFSIEHFRIDRQKIFEVITIEKL
jgi:hypothetical protein